MQNVTKLWPVLLSGGVLALLSGCGGDSAVNPGQVLLTCAVPQVPNAAGTACVAPKPIKCPAPTVPDAKNEQCVIGVDPNAPAPSVMAGPRQAVLYFKKLDGNYEGYRLHTWNNDACDALEPSSIAASWADGLPFTGVDRNYGAYWVLNLKEGVGSKATDCANFLVHIGVDDAGKELGGDQKLPLGVKAPGPQFSRMGWTFSGTSSVFAYPVVSLGVQISDSAAHWLDKDTFVWKAAVSGGSQFKLHHSAAADLAIDSDTLQVNGTAVNVTPVELTDEQKARVPHLASWPAYKINTDAANAKAILKNQLVLASYDSSNKLIAASYVQTAKAIDDLYTKGDNDANEAVLGIQYDANNITSSVWAPTARSVALKVYDQNKALISTNPMVQNATTGVWQFSGSKASLDRKFYRFEVQVYHPLTKKVETVEATDPYSLNVSTNGRFSQFVNLADADTKPANWDSHTVPTIANPEDAIIYEGHIRDFSVMDETVTAANRGKYLAFTETNSKPVQHLAALAEAGVNHFHLLPTMDIATINEDGTKRIDLNNTVAELCKINAKAAVCNENGSTKLIDLMKSYAASGENQQKVVESIRSLDSFNWGYDPHHFLAPEGSYASSSEGVARIKEMRAMNQALHGLGMRVVLDVVYNHTSSSGLFDNSVFDKIVPGYYHRYNEVSGAIERSTCCENTATEHAMVDKFVKDSLVILAKEYKFDSFRFDIMGHHPKQSILAARDAVQAVDPDNYFYGEAWNFGADVQNDKRFMQARQANMGGTQVGTFNDRIRDAVRSAQLFSGRKAENNALAQQNFIEIGLAGTLKDYLIKDYKGVTGNASGVIWNGQAAGYAMDPADIINYVSKHDNETLWDKLQLELSSDVSTDDRVRIHNMALAIPLLSQGIPFQQMGDDLLRSKSLDRDSYDAGDWFNRVDFSMQSNNWNVGLPLAEKNASNWKNIASIASNPNTSVNSNQIELASAVFKDFVKIRQSSPLFRLTTAQQVIDRVGFHNIGKNLTPGLIVMSIDDGSGLADLDPQHDAIVVVINGTDSSKTHRIPTAQNFSLHTVQQQSEDNVVGLARFANDGADGSFTVPAYTAAVFVKVQNGSQGAGLKANATMGAADIPPFGLTTVNVRGGMNGWSENDAFSYDGSGIYLATVQVNAGVQEFKIASGDWSTVDFGGANSDALQIDTPTTLAKKGSNLKLNFPRSGKYVFTLNAANKDAPVLTVSEYQPYGTTTVYARGTINPGQWTTENPLTYIGENRYRMTIALEAKGYEFKIASSDWSTVDFGAGADGVDVTLGAAKTLAAKGANLKMTLTSAGTYEFIIDASDKNAPVLTVRPLVN